MDQYIGVPYSNIYQTDIMTKTPLTLLEPEIPITIPGMGTKHPNIGEDMTYQKKKNIHKSICQKMRKKDVYETNMQNIYNLSVGKKNK